MTTLAVLFFALSRATSDAWLQQVWIVLAGAAVGALVTVFYVEVAMEEQARRNREPKRRMASNELNMEIAQLVLAYSMVVGRELNIGTQMRFLGGELRVNSEDRDRISDLVKDVSIDLPRVGIDKWAALTAQFGERSTNLGALLQRYSDVLDPNAAGELALLRRLTDSVAEYVQHGLNELERSGAPRATLYAYRDHFSAILTKCNSLLA